MLKDERHIKLLEYIRIHQFARIEELSEELDVAEITIRRDIQELDAAGKLLKIHGGAKSLEDSKAMMDISVKLRSQEFTEEKNVIAAYADKYLKDGMKIYLDAGTSTAALIPILSKYDVTVYTHGVHHLSTLMKYKINTYMIGGKVKFETLATVGSATVTSMRNYYFDVAFIGTNAIDVEFGCSTPDEEEAIVKQVVINQSGKTYALADSSKFNKKSYVSFAALEDVSIITNQKPLSSAYDHFDVVYPID